MGFRELTQEQIKNYAAKIENEGLDYYFNEGGWGREDFKGTVIEPFMAAYIDARWALIEALERIGAWE